jgi:hypothetical protein
MLVNAKQNCIHLTYHYYSFHDAPTLKHTDEDVCAAFTILSYTDPLDDWQIIINLKLVYLCVYLEYNVFEYLA